ncbi:MAG: hypothetical protein QG573_1591 [Acidobacteriota bacterium]|nr:hypothetical protein [Acidobacteriota bacterium]
MLVGRRVPPLMLALALSPSLASAQGLSTYRAQMWDEEQIGLPDAAESVDELGSAVASGDFNGDGYSDLAMGAPHEALPIAGDTASDAGVVVVLYGSSSGVVLAGAQAWSQDSPGIAEQVEEGDLFGWSLASGDFDGDGYDDLAVGAYTEDLPGAAGAGVVHLIYGGAGGLAAARSQLWSAADPLVLGEADASDSFGWSLAAGDFDGDTYDDLAIGVPNDGGGASGRSGGLNVIYGGASGLAVAGNQHWYGLEVAGSYEDGCRFAEALATGDFDADGYADLAVGAPMDDFIDQVNVGSTRVLFGSDAGLGTDRDVYLLGPEALGWQGKALVAGDFDGDGDDDLALGIPGRTVTGHQRAGAVAVKLGDGGSFLDAGEWSQDTAGVQGGAEVDDRLGSALACGDFDRDGYADLAIGVPREMVVDAIDGVVHVLRGTLTGPTAIGDQLWTRAAIPVPDPSPGNGGDRLGFALAAGDFDGSGQADLVIGVPGESLAVGGDPGAVLALYGVLFGDGFESQDTSAWSAVAP